MALQEIETAKDVQSCHAIKVQVLGKKVSSINVPGGLGRLWKEERPIVGELANQVRQSITAAIDEKRDILESIELEKKLQHESIDVTLPGRPPVIGGTHILTSIIEEIEDFFIGMGYEVRE